MSGAGLWTLGEAAVEIGVERRTLKTWVGLFPTIQPARGSEGQNLLSVSDLEFFYGVRVLVLGPSAMMMRDVRRLVEEQGAEHLRRVGRASCEGLETEGEEPRRTA